MRNLGERDLHGWYCRTPSVAKISVSQLMTAPSAKPRDPRTLWSRLGLAIIIVAALNVLASVLLFQGLTWRLRILGFPAHNLFKPLLLLNATWIAYVAFARGTDKAVFRSSPTFIERLRTRTYWTVLALVVFALYVPVFEINMAD